MNILYIITKILTYPGAYLKGVWEHLTCRALKLPVRSRYYLQGNEWCGHAVHAPAMTPAQAYLLSFIPFMLQCAFAAIFLGASVGPLLIFGLRGEVVWIMFFLEIICLFLGISMACNAFPQWTDAKRQWRLFYGKPTEEELALMEAEIDEAVAAIEAIEEEEAEEAATEEEAEIAEAAGEACETEEAAAIGEEAAAAAAQPAAPPRAAPKFAGTAAKILFAPCNAFFAAGAALERCGITAILAVGIAAALLVLNYA